MEVTYNDPGLRLICEDEDVTTETYGESIAQAIHNRIADLQAAVSLNDIIIGQLTEIGDATFRIILTHNHAMYFSVVNKIINRNQQGEIDKGSVDRIKLLSIEPHVITP